MMTGEAADWLETLSESETSTFNDLVNAYKACFYPSPEIVWRIASQVWKQYQAPTETVNAFVIRLKKMAKRVNMSEESINHAVIQGLRPPIRMAVLQQGLKGLQDTIRTARLAECSMIAGPETTLHKESINSQTSRANGILSKLSTLKPP